MNKNVIATILIILAIGTYFTVTKGMIAQVKQEKATNEQYSSAIENAKILLKTRDKVQEDYKNLSEEDRDQLKKMLPSTVDNIRLVIDMNGIGVKHGFQLRNVKASVSSGSGDKSSESASQRSASPRPALNGSGYDDVVSVPVLDTVDISFSVTAPYLQFISFLQDLEANLRIMDVTHLSVSANDTGIYDFSVSLKTYWLRSQ